MGKFDSAYLSYEVYLNLAESQIDTVDLLYTYINIGEMALAAADTVKSKEMYLKILALFEYELPQYLAYESYDYLAKIAFIRKEYQKAYEYEQLYNQYRDSLSTETRESYKLLRELDQQQTQAENQQRVDRIIEIFLGIAILLISIAFIFMYRSYNERQKYLYEQRQNAELMQKIDSVIQKQEVEVLHAMLQGQEEERDRIGRTLHDTVGATLSTVKLYFNTINQKLNIVQEETNARVLEANELLDNVMKQVRNLSHDLSKDMLIRDGLVEAIKTFAERIKASGQVTVLVNSYGFEQDEDRLAAKLERLIFRMTQELTGNAIKHGKADGVTIQLAKDDDLVNLMVIDNGKGFNYEEIKKNKTGGIGLHGFDLQVRELGGFLEVDSQPGTGRETTIIIEIPLKTKTKAE
ncbi:MAG: sensor histidine kinase [Bacteroidota bacterium]